MLVAESFPLKAHNSGTFAAQLPEGAKVLGVEGAVRVGVVGLMCLADTEAEKERRVFRVVQFHAVIPPWASYCGATQDGFMVFDVTPPKGKEKHGREESADHEG